MQAIFIVSQSVFEISFDQRLDQDFFLQRENLYVQKKQSISSPKNKKMA